MSDTQEPTAAQKKENIIQALGIAGFTENPEYPGMYARDKGDIREIVDMTAGLSSHLYDIAKKQKILSDDATGTLGKLSHMIVDAEDGRMPTKSTPDEVVNVPKKDESAPSPKTPTKDNVDTPPEPAQGIDAKEVYDELKEEGVIGKEYNPPTELVHSTAPPAPFIPQGTMIKDILPGLAEIGAIKIGGKGEEKKSRSGDKTYRLPVKFDHFEVITKHKDEHGIFIPDATIMELIGDDAKELKVSLLYNDPSLNFFTRYNQYQGGKCKCSGDGVTAIQADGTKIKCNPDTCTIFKAKHCKPNGILSVILKDAPQLGGVYKFRTTSFNSIRSILSSMFFIQSLTGGRLANIPLKMTISPMSVNPVSSPTAQTIYVVNLIYPGTVDDLRKTTLQLMTEQAGMHSKMIELEAQARVAISAPETEEAIQDVESEFYPDNAKEEST